MKNKVLIVRITEDQDRILKSRADISGFSKKADYVRYVLFIPMNVNDMIKEIYEKIVK